MGAIVIGGDCTGGSQAAIVVGARRRTSVGDALMGSDVQQVIMGAEIPVLTVKDLHGRPGITVS